MSIISTIGKGMAWNATGVVIGKVLIFLNVFIMLRYLSVHDYGLAQLVLSVVSLVGIVLLPSLGSAVLADLAAERSRGELGKMKSLFLQFSIFTTGLGAISWLALFLFADVAAHLSGNDTVGSLLKIASFSLLFMPMRSLTGILASVELRYVDQSLISVLEEAVKAACLVLFLFVMHLGVSGLLLSVVVSQFLTVLLFLPRSISAFSVFRHAPAQEPYAFLQAIRAHRKWSVATSYVGNLGQTILLWIIKFLLGTEAVGLYSFAQGIYSQVASLMPLGSTLAPILPRYIHQRDIFARYVKSALKAQSLLVAPLLVATWVGLPILVVIFPKYLPAEGLVAIMILNLIPASVANLYMTSFIALKEQYGFFWSTIFRIAVTVLVAPPAILLFGVPGIAVVMIIVSTISAFERSWRLRRVLPEYGFALRDFFSFDEYEKALIKAVVQRWRGTVARFLPM